MHWTRWIAVGLLFSMTGCALRRSSGPYQSFPGTGNPSAPPPEGESAIVTPASPRVGRITLVNASARYVIITYSLGHVPARESRLHAYRGGLKVAELKVTDFSRDINTVADIVAGECRVGDEVRDN